MPRPPKKKAKKKSTPIVFLNEIEPVISLCKLFADIRKKYSYKNNFPDNIKKYYSVENPTQSRYFPYFHKLLLVIRELQKSNPKLTAEDYITAQFEIKGKEVYPTELPTEIGVKRLAWWEKKGRPRIKEKEVDVDLLINRDEEFVVAYKRAKGILDEWSVNETYQGKEIPLPLFWFITKRISMYLYIFEERFVYGLKDLIPFEDWKRVVVTKEKLKGGSYEGEC